ncbi:T-cell surface glycoprotein CD3 epsilon chain-like [Syngnathus acus]|uniref:T-cell surface glycoprotein CD3 epsilon chain-like n=1 Tax=Syngnathus acus TaxID=161584 RepID=UPI001886136F|nr:T-cell surface glycoprotein CD3 epsilon chain-like [Syngnathus acus]
MYNFALFFCHLLILSAVEANTGAVSFWRETFTMTCPETGTWFKKGESESHNTSKSLTVEGNNQGLYHCKYNKSSNEIKYYFYVEGKVCANCFELDAELFGIFIVADVSITIILMILIYKCTKRISLLSTKGPDTPSPDYDELKAQDRSQDPYSFINSGRSR